MADSTVLLAIFYVYALFDWRGRLFYIGKGSARRHREHLKHRSSKARSPFAARVRQTCKKLGDLPLVILADGLTEVEAFDLERRFISVFGFYPDGELLNRTPGGEGGAGAIRSTEAKQRYRQAARNRWAVATEEERKNAGAILHAPGAEEKRRAALRKPKSVAHRRALSVAAANRYQAMTDDEKHEYVVRLTRNPESVRRGYELAALKRTGKKRGPYKTHNGKPSSRSQLSLDL